MNNEACINECISVDDAWRQQHPGEWRDFSDGASTRCASCPGYVCLLCGTTPVPQPSGLCAPCRTRACQEQWEEREKPAWLSQATAEALAEYEEIAAWPDPRTRLTRLVGEIVRLTGLRYPTVNSRLNTELGVDTREGADDAVIRRCVVLALCWRDAEREAR